MRWYQDKLFPKLMKWNIGKPVILQKRKVLLQKARGNVLEIGIGEGTNLPFYPNHITSITAVDSYPRRLPESSIEVSVFVESAAQMQFPDDTFDTVVSTFTLCSVENLHQVCSEIMRVLKPGGMFLFLEHGSASNIFFKNIQNLINPLYKHFAYGCNITRTYIEEIDHCGMILTDFKLTHAPIYPRFLTGYLYQGVAVKQSKEVYDEKVDL